MKKLYFILFTLICLVACQPKEEPKPKSELANTIWRSEVYVPMMGSVELKLNFTSDTEVTFSIDDGEQQNYFGTYTYSKPTVQMTFDLMSISGTIDGNQMYVTVEEMPVVFVKQATN